MMASYIFLPQDVLTPEEVSKERVRDTHVFGGEVIELMFIGAGWFAADLNWEGDELG